jgi:hypothetical protein
MTPREKDLPLGESKKEIPHLTAKMQGEKCEPPSLVPQLAAMSKPFSLYHHHVPEIMYGPLYTVKHFFPQKSSRTSVCWHMHEQLNAPEGGSLSSAVTA